MTDPEIHKKTSGKKNDDYGHNTLKISFITFISENRISPKKNMKK